MKKEKKFTELYAERKEMQTPAQAFVAEVAQLTERSEFTVRQWLAGVQKPEPLVQRVIAEHFNVNPQTLF